MNDDRSCNLIDGLLDESLSPEEQAELRDCLRASAEARRQYWDSIEQHVLVEDILRESRGLDLAAMERDDTESVVSLSRDAAPHSRFWLALLSGAACCLVLAAGWFVLRNQTSEAVRIAKVRSLSGIVSVRDAGGRLKPASAGVEIRRGEAVVVNEEDATADVVLEDGSTFHLDADSILSFCSVRASEPCELRLERGGLLVDAVPQSAGKPLVLTTEHASVNVEGTRFRLYTDKAMSRVELDEGSVTFQQQSNGQSIEVGEGYYAVALAKEGSSENAPPMSAQPLSTAVCQLRQTLLRAGRIGCISHDGRFFAAPKKDSLRVWSLETGEIVESVSKLDPRHFRQVAFSTHDRAVVAIDAASATVWQRGDASARVFPLHQEQVRHTALSPDGACIAQSYSSNKTDYVGIWHLNHEQNETMLGASVALKPWSSSLVPSSSGSFVAVGEWSGQIDVLDGRTGEVRDKLRVRSTPHPLTIAEDGRFVAAFANKEGLVLLNREPTAESARRVLWPNTGARPACLRFSADGGLLFAGMDDGLVRVWDTSSGELLLVLETGDPRVAWLDLSADGGCLVTGGQNDSVKVWTCEWAR